MAMLAWPAIDSIQLSGKAGLEWWPYLCFVGQFLLARESPARL